MCEPEPEPPFLSAFGWPYEVRNTYVYVFYGDIFPCMFPKKGLLKKDRNP